MEKFQARILWFPNVFLVLFLHVSAAFGIYQLFFAANWLTLGWVLFLWIAGGMGVTAGAHRLWTHRSYKAKLPLQWLLMLLNCVACQNDIIEWTLTHRTHHKWSDTDADPHNVNRGFFFSHMGWLMMEKHPQVVAKYATIDLSDLTSDPLLVFQRKYYLLLALIFGFLIPTAIPVNVWGEAPIVAFFTAGMFRYAMTLQTTFLVNSVAHIWGYKPYDGQINATEHKLTMVLAGGEGGHNFHHTFPQDYRTSEMPTALFNLSKRFIDLFAWLGWAYDLRTASEESIEWRKGKRDEGHERVAG